MGGVVSLRPSARSKPFLPFSMPCRNQHTNLHIAMSLLYRHCPGLAAQGRAWLPNLKALHARLAVGQGGEPHRRVQVSSTSWGFPRRRIRTLLEAC